jgi:hypothetical protein
VATASNSTASRRSALQVTRRSLARPPGTTTVVVEETLPDAVRVLHRVIASPDALLGDEGLEALWSALA